jgi:hypothetical protein
VLAGDDFFVCPAGKKWRAFLGIKKKLLIVG